MPPNSPIPQPPSPNPAAKRPRLGLFGGSFDPVHNGHLLLAEHARDAARLDAVWFIPTARQPHKPAGPVASDRDRVEMLRLATADRPGLEVATIEIDRGGVSYTVDTLSEIRQRQPSAELFLLMGADTLHDLPNWREPEKILALAAPLVVRRPGEPEPSSRVLAELQATERLTVVDMPAMPVSSSGLRKRIAAGEPIDGMVPAPVAEFITSRRLYRNTSVS